MTPSPSPFLIAEEVAARLRCSLRRIHELTRAKAIPHRKFSVLGTIIAHHDSHGLCYDVRHEDGTVGCYDSRELVVQIEGCDVQVAEILEILAQWGWDRHVSFKEVQNALYEEIKKRRIQDAHRIGKR